jgi:hypothetical protein
MLALPVFLHTARFTVMLVASFFTPRLSLLRESVHDFLAAVKACSPLPAGRRRSWHGRIIHATRFPHPKSAAQ